MTSKQKEKIQKILDKTQYLSKLDFKGDTANEVINYLYDRIYEEEIIYYGNAMDFLSEEDPSLIDSLCLASEYGYEPTDLNSEILATILKQTQMRKELGEIETDIEQVFEEDEEE